VFLKDPELSLAVSSVCHVRQISTIPSFFPHCTLVIRVPETTGASPGRLHQNRASCCVCWGYGDLGSPAFLFVFHEGRTMETELFVL
jgi:hypothetical protein